MSDLANDDKKGILSRLYMVIRLGFACSNFRLPCCVIDLVACCWLLYNEQGAYVYLMSAHVHYCL